MDGDGHAREVPREGLGGGSPDGHTSRCFSPPVCPQGAAAFLLTQLDQRGVPVALQGKEILPAVTNALMEPAEVWNRA